MTALIQHFQALDLLMQTAPATKAPPSGCKKYGWQDVTSSSPLIVCNRFLRELMKNHKGQHEVSTPTCPLYMNGQRKENYVGIFSGIRILLIFMGRRHGLFLLDSASQTKFENCAWKYCIKYIQQTCISQNLLSVDSKCTFLWDWRRKYDTNVLWLLIMCYLLENYELWKMLHAISILIYLYL